MSTPSLNALKNVSAKLTEKGIAHALGGSGLLYALGLTQKVGDWDLMTNASFEILEPVLANWTWKRLGISGHFASHYLVQIELESSVIEIIGGFAIRDASGEVHRIPSDVSGYWNNIPLARPEAWLQAYRLMNRHDKVKILEKNYGFGTG